MSTHSFFRRYLAILPFSLDRTRTFCTFPSAAPAPAVPRHVAMSPAASYDSSESDSTFSRSTAPDDSASASTSQSSGHSGHERQRRRAHRKGFLDHSDAADRHSGAWVGDDDRDGTDDDDDDAASVASTESLFTNAELLPTPLAKGDTEQDCLYSRGMSTKVDRNP